ncbi:ATP-binding cassette subfamily C protein [Methylopila capsulata]|uniref:ATP-binding cassette subfamily C protein n=1 Tax=Methylopila capsulata TaxID=61654 RepID=A0ABS2TB56_9HYPH|nr:ABC transporter ATP-binding protein [Methylopila capsulata]MBM7853437.1 ATP-binding cassette subfamily C protein [Methylopila capsulata]
MRRSVLILFCLVLAGVAEGLGVASLLPLITLIGEDGGGSKGAKVADVLSTVGLQPTIGVFLAILVIGMALKATLSLVALHQVGRAVADVAVKMRLQLIDALLAARWSYYVRQPVGRFSNALGGEANQAGETYNQAAQLVADLIQVATYVTIVALFSWKLALLSLAVGLLMVLTLNRFVTIAKRTARKQNRHVKRMIGGLTDLLVGIKPMKAMGRHARFQSLFERDAETIRRAQRKQSFARHANKTLQEPILAICLAAGIYAALVLGSAPPGEVLVMSVLLVRTVTTIGKAQQGLQALRIAEAGFVAVTETIELARRARESLHPGATPSFERAVAFRDVSFAYDREPVIENASFEVPKGLVTTITGGSGAGKTTTVDLLLGLHEPTAGEILIDGAPLAGLDLVAWRRMTGYVPQELILFHDTLLSNVTLGQPEFTREDVERALEAAGAADFVAKLPEGVETIVGERGARLSGGQRQRIAIARALIHRPQLLILDEATTALDPDTEANIVRNVMDLARSTGLTVLAISHQPAWARAADHVVHLAEGRVVKVDSHAA